MMTTMFKKKAATLLQCALLTVLVASCGGSDDDGGDNEPMPARPTVAVQGAGSIIVKSGETINVTLTLNAEGGSKELVVNRGGGFLEAIPLTPTQTTFTYNSQTVPADAEEGEEFSYTFVLVDLEDQESTPAPLTVSTRVYDEITIGGELLYNVDITDDGIVPPGTNVKLIEGRNYYLGSSLLFEAGTSLTIEEGVHWYMDAEAASAIEVNLDNGASVSIIGTATNPVVFTSTAVLGGTPAPGDWDRLRIGNVTNSTVRYVRSEYAGEGFRVANTDNSNTIDHVAVFFPAEEGIYVTNGNVNLKYLVVVNSGEGAFRFGDAYAGKVQFGIAQLSETFADNEELTIRETSTATIANFTLIGPGSDQPNVHGARLRASSQGKIYSTIITAYPRRGIRTNDDVVITDLNGPTVFAYSYIWDVPTDPYRDDTANGNPFRGFIDGNGEFQNPFFNNVTGFDGSGQPILTPIAGIGTNDFIPDEPVTAAESFNPNTIDAFFTSVTFVGAVENEAGDWTKGWVKNPDGTIR